MKPNESVREFWLIREFQPYRLKAREKKPEWSEIKLGSERIHVREVKPGSIEITESELRTIKYLIKVFGNHGHDLCDEPEVMALNERLFHKRGGG